MRKSVVVALLVFLLVLSTNHINSGNIIRSPREKSFGASQATGNSFLRLDYSSYLGGSDNEWGAGVVFDASGNAIVTGITGSSDFPTTTNAYQENKSGDTDVFIAKFSSDGQLIYSTFLGGSGADNSRSVSVDSSGNVIVSGFTNSNDFPTTVNAYQGNFSGGNEDGDAFVAKLSADGQSLIFSTYLGGSDNEHLAGMSIDSSGNIVVTGVTSSDDFPTTTGSYQESHGGGLYDVFLAKFSSNGESLVFSTFLGGYGHDHGSGVTLDATGNVVIAGFTGSNDFPTVNAIQESHGGGLYDVFVAKLDPEGRTSIFSTFLGGSSDDTGVSVAVDATGISVSGYTTSNNFPTVNAFQKNRNGSNDALLFKLSSNGQSLIFSTFIGGSYSDYGAGVAVNATGNGNVLITGRTYSSDFPTVKAIQKSNNGSSEGFLAIISPEGQSFIHSTYLGGDDEDGAWAVALGDSDNIAVIGYTYSLNFPTLNAYQEKIGGINDFFICKFVLDHSSTETTTTVSASSEITSTTGFELVQIVSGITIAVVLTIKRKELVK
ncbi:MAG: SBBP repeat-containing protein [Candidatus Hodarchaeales archaeon]